MGYSHFGNIGDIWKHVPLCNFLANESPRKYIESNSAYAYYKLNNTPEQQYGVYNFYKQALSSADLVKLPFVNLLKTFNNTADLTHYLGSPGLAMKFLMKGVEQYIFFDLDNNALQNIKTFADDLKLNQQVVTRNEDSIEGVHHLIQDLNQQDFIHFDPYLAFEKNQFGRDYFDIFLEATQRNIKCMLWYGYNTLKQ